MELGIDKKSVLAKRGTKVLYNVSSCSRDHITCVLTVSAAGQMAPPRCVFRGTRNVAATHLASLPVDGKSGCWGLTSTEKGFITAKKFVLILQDLVKFLEENQIRRPVILFMDGAAPHISLAMADYCKLNGIQPWLFKPNTTHLTQPLDLTVMKSLKDVLKRKVTAWQQSHTTSLTKYTVVPLLRESVEELLMRPEVIVNGFRRAGIVPWDPSAIDTRKMIPSSIFSRPPAPEVEIGGLQVEPMAGSSKPVTWTSSDMSEIETNMLLHQTSVRPPVTTHVSPEMVVDLPDIVTEQQIILSPDTKNPPSPEIELPQFTPRNLLQFEAVFMTEPQVKKCEDMFSRKVKSSNPIFLAWKALKMASLPTEEEAVQAVLESHTPKNIEKKKTRSGRKVPDGVGRFNSISDEWIEIMEQTPIKKAKGPLAKKTTKSPTKKPVTTAPTTKSQEDKKVKTSKAKKTTPATKIAKKK